MTSTASREGTGPKCAACGHGTLAHNAIGGACTKCDCGHYQPPADATVHHCKRPGCTGVLRSAESIRRGTSKACAMVLARQVAEAKQGFKPEQVANAEAAIASGHVRLDRDKAGRLTGLFMVKSARSGEWYRLDGASCVCPAGARAHSLRCWHRLAVAIWVILHGAPVPGRPLAKVIPLPVPAPRPAEAPIWDRLTVLGATGSEDFIPQF